MSLKVVADCVEAVVGAYLSSVGHEAATRVAVAMGAVPAKPPQMPPRPLPTPATSSSIRCGFIPCFVVRYGAEPSQYGKADCNPIRIWFRSSGASNQVGLLASAGPTPPNLPYT